MCVCARVCARVCADFGFCFIQNHTILATLSDNLKSQFSIFPINRHIHSLYFYPMVFTLLLVPSIYFCLCLYYILCMCMCVCVCVSLKSNKKPYFENMQVQIKKRDGDWLWIETKRNKGTKNMQSHINGLGFTANIFRDQFTREKKYWMKFHLFCSVMTAEVMCLRKRKYIQQQNKIKWRKMKDKKKKRRKKKISNNAHDPIRLKCAIFADFLEWIHSKCTFEGNNERSK